MFNIEIRLLFCSSYVFYLKNLEGGAFKKLSSIFYSHAALASLNSKTKINDEVEVIILPCLDVYHLECFRKRFKPCKVDHCLCGIKVETMKESIQKYRYYLKT